MKIVFFNVHVSQLDFHCAASPSVSTSQAQFHPISSIACALPFQRITQRAAIPFLLHLILNLAIHHATKIWCNRCYCDLCANNRRRSWCRRFSRTQDRSSRFGTFTHSLIKAEYNDCFTSLKNFFLSEREKKKSTSSIISTYIFIWLSILTISNPLA